MADERHGVDPGLLETEIAHEAHVIDKTLDGAPERREMLLAKHAPKLACLLGEWSRQGHPKTQCVAWAEGVFQHLTTGSAVTAMQAEHMTTMNGAIDVIRSRRSVRRWTEKSVDDELIQQLVTAARWAPSSGNRQAVRMVILRTDDAKAAVARFKEPFFRRAPILIVVGVDIRIYGTEERDSLLYLDSGAAIQNMLLAGHSLGLGCVWGRLGIQEWGTNPKAYYEMKQQLALPGWFRPVSVVAAGWPAGVIQPPPRRDPAATVTFDEEGFPPDSYPDWRPKYLGLWAVGGLRLLRRVARLLIPRRPARHLNQ